jgi:hypothetical protein
MTAPLQRPFPPTGCPPAGSLAARKFSNDWKKSFQSLEKPAWIFQPLEKTAKIFSNHWKTGEKFFQSLENPPRRPSRRRDAFGTPKEVLT